MVIDFRRIGQRILYYLNVLNSSKRVLWIVFCCYFWYVIFLQGFNVLWFDEGHEMMLIRESASLGQFIDAMQYEGTPWLVHGLVYLLQQITGDTLSAAIFIHVCTLISIGLIVCFALDLSSSLVLLILLSPALSEYLLNVRQYPMAVLMMLVFAAFYKQRPASIGSRIALLIVAQISVNAFLVSMGLFGALFMINFDNRKDLLRDVFFCLLTVILTISQLIPASDLVSGLKGWHLISMEKFWPAWLEMWGMIFVSGSASGIALVAMVVGTVLLLAIKKEWRELLVILVPFIIAMGGATAVLFLKYRQCERHIYLLSWMLCALLLVVLSRKSVGFCWRNGLFALSLVLLPAIVSEAENTFINHLLLPKTGAENVANYIRTDGESKVLLLYPEMNSEAPLYYLGNERLIYALGRERFIKRLEWNHPSVDYVQVRGIQECVKMENLAARVAQLPRELVSQRPMLLVSGVRYVNTDLENPFEFDAGNARVHLLRSFRWSRHEWYLVYGVEPK